MEPTLILHQTSIASVKMFQHVSYVINGESIVKAAGRRSKKFASLNRTRNGKDVSLATRVDEENY